MSFRGTALSLALILLAACRRPSAHAVERIAILPFENLSADASFDWIAKTAPFILSQQASGATNLVAAQLNTEADTPAIRPTQILRGYFTAESGKLRVRGFLSDALTNRNVRKFSAEVNPAGGALAVADAFARQLVPHPRPFSTKNEAAVKFLGEALTAVDAATSTQALEHALEADPGFGLGYITLTELYAARGDRAAVDRWLGEARRHAGQMNEVDRAQIELFSAEAAGSPEATAGALRKLAALRPADVNIPRRLAETEQRAHHFAEAAGWMEKAAKLEPETALLWNSLGYAKAYAGDYSGARESLEQYRKLAPSDPNPLDSMGEVMTMAQRFGEAEKAFLQAYDRNALLLGGVEMYKAAFARLMTGDISGADGLAGRYFASPSQDPLREVRKAHWDYLCGRRKKAIGRMSEVAAAAKGDIASIANSFLAVWLLETGNPAAAGDHATKAAASATTAVATAVAMYCRFITQPPASSTEWALRGERSFPDPRQEGMKRAAIGYALLFGKHFEAAAPVYREQYRHAGPTGSDEARMALAWALIETGNSKEATPLLANFPLAPALGEAPFASVIFPRVHYLYGKLTGKRESLDLFLKLSGDTPLIFGEEARARGR